MAEPIAIFIPDEDAKKFLQFQKHYAAISLLLENDVFKTKNGSVELHFDSAGSLKSIVKHEIVYRFGIS